MDFKNIRFIGRYIIKDNQGYFSFSGSGFEFKVKPDNNQNCFIKLVLNSEIREESYQFLAIYINDVFYSKYMIIGGKSDIYIPLNKLSKIRIIKANGHMEELDPPIKKKLVGFFGDSLTCGFGLLDYHGEVFRMETEDFTKTYAYLACDKLNMDYDVVARSGISIGVPMYLNTLFKDIYDTVDMFEKYIPHRVLDYAVVNLGANDNTGILQSQDINKALDTFKEEYQSLVERIINDNPNVTILLCYQTKRLDERVLNKIKEVKEYISSNYENIVQLVEFIPNQDGACYHPFFLTHADNAKILEKAILELEKPTE